MAARPNTTRQPPTGVDRFRRSRIDDGPRLEKLPETKMYRRVKRTLGAEAPLPKALPGYYVGKAAEAERRWRDRYPGDVAGKED